MPRDVDDGKPRARNVLGGALLTCSQVPLTGFYRDGCCNVGPEDMGVHSVCAVMTDAFLAFSKARGNDLSTPLPEFGFPGLVAGDRWCLCLSRWKEAYDADAAPLLVLEATHEVTLQLVPLDVLRRFAAPR